MVLLLGCGYAGLYVARLLKPHYLVTVTTRSAEKKALLSQECHVELLDSANIPSLKELLQDQEILIIMVAASSAAEYHKTYLETALHIKEALSATPSLQCIIYTSSTSVYGDIAIATEESPCHPLSEQGVILHKTEEVLLSLPIKKVVIFRAAEIYGPSRTFLQKVEKLQHKKAPGDGLQQANTIHVEDLARAILFAIQYPLQGVYNLCDEEKITRKELYDKVSARYHLPRVQWDPLARSLHSSRKIVSNEKIKKAGFIFHHPRKEI